MRSIRNAIASIKVISQFLGDSAFILNKGIKKVFVCNFIFSDLAAVASHVEGFGAPVSDKN